jgi:signal transduction histidine kinase
VNRRPFFWGLILGTLATRLVIGRLFDLPAVPDMTTFVIDALVAAAGLGTVLVVAAWALPFKRARRPAARAPARPSASPPPGPSPEAPLPSLEARLDEAHRQLAARSEQLVFVRELLLTRTVDMDRLSDERTAVASRLDEAQAAADRWRDEHERVATELQAERARFADEETRLSGELARRTHETEALQAEAARLRAELDLSRAEAKALVLEPEAVDVESALRQAAREGAERPQRQLSDFLVAAEPGLPLVLADRARLAQILDALVQCGGAAETVLSARPAGKFVALGVAHPDLTVADGARLFDPLAANGEDGATRVRLALARSLATLSGGELTVTAGEVTGAVFTLTLPAATRGDGRARPRAHSLTDG